MKNPYAQVFAECLPLALPMVEDGGLFRKACVRTKENH